MNADQPPAKASQIEFFERKVRPLLVEHCYSCHSADAEKLQAGLYADSRAALIHGGDSGAAIVPGDPDASLLVDAVRYDGYEMPPKGKLSDEDIATFEQWVAMDAPWPDEEPPTSNAVRLEFDLATRKADHWIWQSVQRPAIPDVRNMQWPRSDIDRFVLAKLETQQLKPANDVERSALLRRLYFDLIGLPPTPEQAASFLADESPHAIERLVDGLLASPHFGERWARHWLDLVRYAESRGHEFDNDAPNAFRYRDYIIRALNADVPHDELVREHIAGDLIPEPRLNAESGFNESVLGTGFWFLGEWVHSPVDIRKDEADRFDNMIDVMSKTFLGVTVSCARCHDHKFDAISTADYYSLAGFLQSSDFRQVRFESLEHNGDVAEQLAAVDAKYREQLAGLFAEHGLAVPVVDRLASTFDGSIVVDYGSLPATEYRQDGFIFGAKPIQLGEPYWSQSGEKVSLQFAESNAAINDPIWNGLKSINEKGVADRSRLGKIPRSGRTLRTPTFTLTNELVACRVRGAGHVVACVDSHRLIAGPLHGETVKPIKAGDDWVVLNLKRYLGHNVHLEFTPDAAAQLEISLVAHGLTKQQRQQADKNAATNANTLTEYSEAARQVLDAEGKSLVDSWTAERSALRNQIQFESRLAMAMLDGTGEDDRVLIRGNSSKPGDVEPRHFLTAIAGDGPMEIQNGSGRLELAEAINDSANPLTARVAVNRIWHYLMGRGIVPTTDDFGVLGQRPSHPELLDYLATQFVEDGRSIKKMIRRIALSRTYQMSSQSRPEAIAVDPKNMLWHHRPPKRLEGEVIRDSLLALSGQLDATMYGQSVPVHLTAFMDGRGRPKKSGPLDGAGRRSIYTSVRRNFLSPFMLTFDTPAPFSTMGRRNVSNVPAQALILLNDPLVVEQAKKWAERAVGEAESAPARIDWMYQSAFARTPTDRELAVASSFLKSASTERGVSLDDVQLWADFAHALINTKEFIFLR